jgi:DNA-binding SARP family transcriptional activator
VRAARLAGEADAPVTHIIVCAQEPTADQAARLARILQGAPAMCAAVVSGTPVPVDGQAWVLPATGGPEILTPTGVPITGQFLADPTYAELIEHFRISGDLDSTPDPGRVATGIDGIGASGKDEQGARGPELDGAEADFDGDDLETSTPEPTTMPAPDRPTASVTEPSNGTVPQSTTILRAEPGQDDDFDLASPRAPRLLLLGPIQLLDARGSVEPSRAPRLRELAAFLKLNPDAGSTQLIEAVWPDGTTRANKDTSVHKLRSWLGRDDTGEPYFPKARGGYRLAESVGCDLLEFRAHYGQAARARREGRTREAAAHFEAAIALVRGRPFAGAEPKRYGWAEPAMQATVSEIVDAVRYLARMHMAEGDWMTAATIAAWGMGIGPEHESLFRLRFEAVYRTGDQAELDRLSTALQARLEYAGMSMQDETSELLEELLDRRAVISRF